MSNNPNKKVANTVFTIVGIVLCVVLIPILIVNCTLLVKSLIHKDKVPDFAGVTPLIVLSDSMLPDFASGDLIICTTIDAKDVALNDVISFYDPAGNGTTVVTHKVVEIVTEDGELFFRTKGINNNTEDKILVPASSVIAKYSGICLAGMGDVAIFMQSTWGLIICIGVPVLLFIGYDIIRRKSYDKQRVSTIEALQAELDALRGKNK